MLCLLLQGYFVSYEEDAWPIESNKDILPCPSGGNNSPSNCSNVLPKPMERVSFIFFVAIMSFEFRRVTVWLFRGFECIGPSAIYRISLSFLCLFFLMMVFMLCRNRFSMVVNEGLFCVKYALVLGTFIAFLFVKG